MSKTHVKPSVNFEKAIMAKVSSNEISMKPKWYFVLGSILTIISFSGLSIGAIFLTNLTIFSLRKHGPMGQWRLQQLIESFPLWMPILAALGMVLGMWVLRKYDFSYKKNFRLIVLAFVVSVFLTAIIIDTLGLNDAWSRRGPMRRLYQQVEEGKSIIPQGPEQRRGWGFRKH